VASLSGYLAPRALFGLEPDEAREKCEEALKVAERVLTLYHETRASITSTPPPKDCAGNQLAWEFDNNLVLGRLRSYVDRVRVFLEVAEVRIDYEKLEKVELSNAGEHAKVLQCMTDFNEWYAAWTARTGEEGPEAYNPFDPTNPRFGVDHAEFTSLVRDIDLRLGSIAAEQFKTQISVEGYFRVINIFQGILARPAIAPLVQVYYHQMIDAFRSVTHAHTMTPHSALNTHRCLWCGFTSLLASHDAHM
jgi:hypothetical protein